MLENLLGFNLQTPKLSILAFRKKSLKGQASFTGKWIPVDPELKTKLFGFIQKEVSVK